MTVELVSVRPSPLQRAATNLAMVVLLRKMMSHHNSQTIQVTRVKTTEQAILTLIVMTSQKRLNGSSLTLSNQKKRVPKLRKQKTVNYQNLTTINSKKQLLIPYQTTLNKKQTLLSIMKAPLTPLLVKELEEKTI